LQPTVFVLQFFLKKQAFNRSDDMNRIVFFNVVFI
jgi:hypothetical protein